MFIYFLLLVLGFIILLKGADFFVDGASSAASNLKVPKIIIGLTIIAFGTSAPELAVSFKALSSGSADMVLGNVIGSNILNILLILGIAAVIHPIHIEKGTIRKELPIYLLLSTLLVILFLDSQLTGAALNQISRSDGLTILLFFGVFLYYLVTTIISHRRKAKSDDEKPKFKLLPSLALTILGLAGIFIGSNLVVDNATGIARSLGVSERIIALTVIAIGTSLPELITTIVSAKKHEDGLLLGNIIGSNIFNICVVLGIPVSIFGGITPSSFEFIDIIMLIVSAGFLAIAATSKKNISRVEGAVLIALFLAYYSFIFISAFSA